jgi:hypothetical protein
MRDGVAQSALQDFNLSEDDLEWIVGSVCEAMARAFLHSPLAPQNVSGGLLRPPAHFAMNAALIVFGSRSFRSGNTSAMISWEALRKTSFSMERGSLEWAQAFLISRTRSIDYAHGISQFALFRKAG